MARRAYGSGSLYQTASGRWVGAVSYTDEDGKRRRRTVSGTSERSVRKRLRALVASETSLHDGSEPVGQYLQRWLDEVAAVKVRASTLKNYRRAVRNIEPALGNIQLSTLTAGDIQRAINRLPGKPGTRGLALKVIGTALQHATRTGLIPANPARLVVAPRVPREPLDTWTADEARCFLEGTRGDRWWPLWVLALTTGMRQGELLGLRWEDIDGDTVRVQRTVRQVSRYVFEENEPKTPRSRRTLTLSPLALEALGQLVPANRTDVSGSEEQPTPEGYVFAREDGRPWAAGSVRDALDAATGRLGLPRVRFHDLRHTAAALLLDASGGDLRMVQAQLGHDSIRTTVDTYGGRANEARQRAGELLGSVLTDGSKKAIIGPRT